MPPTTIVFVHGWSVTHTDTYGGLPERLAAEARAAGEPLVIADLWLGRYVSFRDEVRMPDLAWAMECAVREQLGELLADNRRFAVITHSTGGPVARAWWHEFYAAKKKRCPMSHLVMLAPANFGSALAQLGKGRLSRMKSWWAGIEPGQGVLDWLEHGSDEAWRLNEEWIRGAAKPGKAGVFPFVLTGQQIDRKVYDHLNSYTGELGSDGVVRAAAANLNAAIVRLEQGDDEVPADGVALTAKRLQRAPRCAFRLIPGASHSGAAMGIMRAVEARPAGAGGEVVEAIRRCLAVSTETQYDKLCDAFDAETEQVAAAERAEHEVVTLWRDRAYVHDAMSMVIVRVTDSEGYPVPDFDLVLTGDHDDPDFLPDGFLADRQRNQRQRHVLTFFLNHDLMNGCAEVRDPRDNGHSVLRAAQAGISTLGLRITPRPGDGFVHYVPAWFSANEKLLRDVVRPHQTTLIDITLRRVVYEGAFRFGPATQRRADFKKTPPGGVLPPQP